MWESDNETGERFGQPLPRDFYTQDTVQTAQALLNCILIHESPEGIRAGRITETEAYTQDDPACHTFRGQTPRNATMFGPPGIAYIYFTYGMYHCFNAVTSGEGTGDAVLIRAVEPLLGWELMEQGRGLNEGKRETGKEQGSAPNARIKLARFLCGGPGKLCQAFGFTRALNNDDLTIRPAIWIAPPVPAIGTPAPETILATPRIGLSTATERLWRFTLHDDPYTSR